MSVLIIIIAVAIIAFTIYHWNTPQIGRSGYEMGPTMKLVSNIFEIVFAVVLVIIAIACF